MMFVNTVDREIFVLEIIRSLNFHVKNISSLDGSATLRVYAFKFFTHLIFIAYYTTSVYYDVCHCLLYTKRVLWCLLIIH